MRSAPATATSPPQVLVLHAVGNDAPLLTALVASVVYYPEWSMDQLTACIQTAAAALVREVGATAATTTTTTTTTAAAAASILQPPASALRFLRDVVAVRAAVRERGAAAVARPIRLIAVSLVTPPMVGLVAAKGESPAPIASTPPASHPATGGGAAPAINSMRRWSLAALPWRQEVGGGPLPAPAAVAPPPLVQPPWLTGRSRVHSCHLFMVVVHHGEIVYNSLLSEPGVRVVPSTAPAVTLKIKGPPLRLQGAFSVRLYHRRTSHAPFRIATANYETGPSLAGPTRAPGIGRGVGRMLTGTWKTLDVFRADQRCSTFARRLPCTPAANWYVPPVALVKAFQPH